MKCPRIYATDDGESHFDEVEISTTSKPVYPGGPLFDVSVQYPSSRVRFTRIPAGVGEVGWHTVKERVLTVRINGGAEYWTSDGDARQIPAGSFILFEDTHGKGHNTRQADHEQIVIWISLPNGLALPL